MDLFLLVRYIPSQNSLMQICQALPRNHHSIWKWDGSGNNTDLARQNSLIQVLYHMKLYRTNVLHCTYQQTSFFPHSCSLIDHTYPFRCVCLPVFIVTWVCWVNTGINMKDRSILHQHGTFGTHGVSFTGSNPVVAISQLLLPLVEIHSQASLLHIDGQTMPEWTHI